MLSIRLWRHATFTRFFLGSSLSIVGNWFNTVAVAVLTFQLTGRASLVAATIAASVLPRALIGPLGGVLADRFEKRRLLVLIDSARAVIALLPLFAHDAAHVWLIYVSVALLQTGSCIYNPAQNAYIPHLVTDEVLEHANAAFVIARDIGMFAGPAVATPILIRWGLGAAFGINALSFVISACVLLTLPKAIHVTAQSTRLWNLMHGYVTIARHYPRITALYMTFFASAAAIYFFQGIIVAYSHILGQPTSFVGVLYAVAGLGGAVGGLTLGHFQRRLPYAAGIAIFGASLPLLGALGFTRHAGSALVLLLLSTAAAPAGELIFVASVQRQVQASERGRAFGLLYWSIAVGQLGGALLGIELAPFPRAGIIGVCFGALPIALAGILLSIRADRSGSMTSTDEPAQAAG